MSIVSIQRDSGWDVIQTLPTLTQEQGKGAGLDSSRYTTTQKLLDEIVEELRISNQLNDQKDKKLEKLYKGQREDHKAWRQAKSKEFLTAIFLTSIASIMATFIGLYSIAATLGIIKPEDFLTIGGRIAGLF